MKKYRLFCTTDNRWEEVLSDNTPTSCPIDTLHTIDADSVSVIDDNVIYNDGTPVDASATLAAYKNLKYNDIDLKTALLISAGFVYDGHTFSLSERAQFNWNALKEHETEFTWPKEVSTKDNNSYSLAQVNLSAFWTAAKDAVNGHLDSGRALKKSVYDAVDRAGVDAVVDNR